MKLYSSSGLKGEIQIPGDKSISHRAVMFGSIAEGKTVITNFLNGADCLSTISCFRSMGADIKVDGTNVEVTGKGIDGLVEPSDILDVGNSGTTTRLILGLLAGTSFHSCLIGDESIAKRPMKRVTEPLKQMGASIDGRERGNLTPISVRGGKLKGISYESSVASAQVKSAILLAGLRTDGDWTSVTEPHKSRDHTERMLKSFGASVKEEGLTVSVKGGQHLKGARIEVPGDISSAAFFLAAGAIVPNSKLVLRRVGINPTRSGILEVLEQMGAVIQVTELKTSTYEPMADITIETSNLKGITISGDLIPKLIDEIPVIALMATQAEGKTIIKDAEELKVKETNRIDTVVNELKKLGADIEATEDGMIINGPAILKGGAEVSSHGDHRIGMMLAIAACLTESPLDLSGADAIKVSYPDFFTDLKRVNEQ
ncbi:3-phosphoshikimate 1-carboxyvinyltransferase [Bacillus sp. FJAT-42376]|uniref:3-phosphoshikimate 1-carboxyvinyltransferase n=1 Tax=Bacillus sp. FJAT-42376 TaxID=2014076 RepID=UPI000F50C161|nr:3-phosphoshikimate 1-carboxyvinyltransferase [Bacillus sp. FJAT-42376]AZB43325.1 3-phosphoshikimate 1-carboxyvinyltransferase [Bacillus sp. FJAT-42376]